MKQLVADVYKEANTVIAMYRGGITVGEIAATYQVGPIIIKEILKKEGIHVE